ncbi:hypothetical protein KR044_008033 [Drosophila immigrans]|nr:hypothetical protein KR044_008033 [Drosophila immigrans]
MNSRDADISNVNLLSVSETRNEELQTGDHLVYNIVDDIFRLRHGQYEQSDSEVHSEPLPSSQKLIVDQRLQYWKDMLRQRRTLQQRLIRDSGKKPHNILFNLDYLKEQTITRNLACTPDIDTNDSSFNKSEDFKSKRKNYIEIVGTPRRVTLELIGDERRSSVVNKWSEFPHKNGANEKKLNFAPNIQRLEAIGKNCWRAKVFGRDSMHTISSPTTSIKTWQTSPNSTQTRGTMTETLSVVINGTRFSRNDPDYSPILEKMFLCNPFEHNLRSIIVIANTGQQPINFYWKRSEFFAYNNTLLIGDGDEFVFDTEPFQLRSGEVHRVNVLFRPSKVGIIKQRWLLTTKPKIFHSYPCALTLNMHGRCKPPQEYLEQLEALMTVRSRQCRNVSKIYKQFKRTISPVEVFQLCPFSRELEEREAFNQRNVGFHCERESDLRDIKDFFEYAKPATSAIEWDFSVSMLIDLVCYNECKSLRFALFSKLTPLLENLRGRSLPLSCGDDQAKLAERRRTRFIFVRGLIANNIELWEEKIWKLGAQMLKKSEFKELNKLIYLKPFRDSIYIYTYDQLCNVVEDIVSVIESTEQV